MASNCYSVAEAYVAMMCGGHVFPFAICNDKRLVGFIRISCGENADQDGVSVEKGNYEIRRFMIDKRYFFCLFRPETIGAFFFPSHKTKTARRLFSDRSPVQRALPPSIPAPAGNLSRSGSIRAMGKASPISRKRGQSEAWSLMSPHACRWE